MKVKKGKCGKKLYIEMPKFFSIIGTVPGEYEMTLLHFAGIPPQEAVGGTKAYPYYTG